ncbi:proline hydroxylase [Pseudomonas sp. ABAC61]|nr:proline hydroxylase [Pseudomonas sp. ABAC61]
MALEGTDIHHQDSVAYLQNLDWRAVEASLANDGFAVLPQVLDRDACQTLAALYQDSHRFRSRIVMERYAFGRGEYQYFAYPLPDTVAELRTGLYSHLAPIANRWHAIMKVDGRFPATHREFKDICYHSGQCRPTPLLLSYGENDYCCLHQDLYGEHVFPFQVVFLLDEPGVDFQGGELLLTESDPKKPGRAEVVDLRQGQAVIFAVNSRPARSTRGFYRVSMRHGVSRIHSGTRRTLGIIFHDAK